MTNMQITSVQNNNIPVEVSMTPNFCSVKTGHVQQDSIKINKKKKNNKNLITTIALGGLGIVAATFAYIKCHKTTPTKNIQEELSAELKEVQQIYKDIFKRDINAEETKDFAQRYKAIIDSKTSDNDREYCEKLLDEICKDRQTKRPKIFRWISKRSNADQKCINGEMATAPDGTYIDIYAYNYHNNPNQNAAKGFFESLFHESHHVKQDEIIYRTDKEFFLQDLLSKFVLNGEGEMYKKMLMNNGGNAEKTLNEVKNLLSEQIDSYWGGFEPFVKNSAEYIEGLRLIEGKKNYKFFGDCTGDEYRKQIIEKGAYEDGEKAEKLFDILKSL